MRSSKIVMVYVVRALSGLRKGLIKIGSTRAPRARLFAIVNSSEVRGPIEVIWGGKSSLAFERELHQWFGPVRRAGEWFSMDEADLALFRSSASEIPPHTVLPPFHNKRRPGRPGFTAQWERL